jgi:hypothetical protein
VRAKTDVDVSNARGRSAEGYRDANAGRASTGSMRLPHPGAMWNVGECHNKRPSDLHSNGGTTRPKHRRHCRHLSVEVLAVHLTYGRPVRRGFSRLTPPSFVCDCYTPITAAAAAAGARSSKLESESKKRRLFRPVCIVPQSRACVPEECRTSGRATERAKGAGRMSVGGLTDSGCS